MPWRYSGSKKRLLKFLPGPPLGTKRIVEPFAGSAAYGLHYRPRELVLAEANTDVRGLWEWVCGEATVQDLTDLEAKKPTEKVDARSLGLPKPQETLIRLMISGAYVGQLSSTVLYPQHSLDLSGIKSMLPYLQTAVQKPVLKDFREAASETGFFFIDPPYIGTEGNYIDKSSKKNLTGGISAAELTDFITKLKQPVLFTYGDDAPETFPAFDWTLAVIRKVPILRGGGTRERREWYCKINW